MGLVRTRALRAFEYIWGRGVGKPKEIDESSPIQPVFDVSSMAHRNSPFLWNGYATIPLQDSIAAGGGIDYNRFSPLAEFRAGAAGQFNDPVVEPSLTAAWLCGLTLLVDTPANFTRAQAAVRWDNLANQPLAIQYHPVYFANDTNVDPIEAGGLTIAADTGQRHIAADGRLGPWRLQEEDELLLSVRASDALAYWWISLWYVGADGTPPPTPLGQ